MRRKKTSTFDDIFEILKHAPVWVGPTIAASAFLFFVIILHSRQAAESATTTLVLSFIGIAITSVVLLAWIGAEIFKFSNRRLLDSRRDAASLSAISWQQFEHLVCEGYRRQGYSARVISSPLGDGGIDIQMTRDGDLVLVQCKQWRAYRVGVKTVREMLGVVVSQRATKGIVVTSGRFTAEAVQFAALNKTAIELIDGTALFEHIRTVQKITTSPIFTKSRSQPLMVPTTSPTPPCPSCGKQMILRVAKKGKNAGSNFWGCPQFPGCRGNRPLKG